MSVDVRAVLPKFKLTLIEVRLLPSEHKREQTGAQTAEGAGLHDAAGCTDLAYVLHTSGTTGLPKIVRVPHRCILPNILHLRSLFQMSADDVVFLASPLTFDPSVVDIFLALSSGAQLLIIPTVIKKMPGRLAHLLFKAHKTTVLQVTPTLLVRFGHRVLKQEVFSSGSSLRVLALGGEACPSPALLRSWRHEDNKTNIYNIYGITEVSCWACCYKIPESVLQPSDHTESFVPLGTPLMDTTVEVRDEHGCIVTEGEGQVFIGGEDRVCLLDDEDTVIPGTMRATGDWVNVKGEQLCYLGRKDRLIKRHGKRVNLDSLQQLILSLPQVEACAVAPYEGLRLLAFVVASTSGDQRAASPLTSVQKQAEQTPSASAEHRDDPHPAVSHHQEEAGGADGDLRRLILSQLSRLLPSYSVPDTLVLVPALCLTSHGKVDMKALIEIYQRQRRCLESDSSRGDVTELKQTLQSLWKAKAERKESSAADETRAVTVIRRAGEVIGMKVRETNIRADALGDKESSKKRRDDALGLSLSWSSDTGRCVDASPVLLVRDRTDEGETTTVFIGSHSHRIQALDLITGGLLWERVLGDRIEASAAVSHCGSLVVVGCYDGCVYFLCASSGKTRWMFETGDAVKSCPAVDPFTGLVIVGSHDGHVYALNPKVQQCVWRRHCGGGAVFSSPCLHPSLRQLYVASLGGHLLCLNPDSGDVLWSYRRDVPFFSSPNVSSGRLVIGSVDGNICCFSDTGELVWQFLTKGPVFSSPCVTPDHQRVLCGSHDGCLYCLDGASGSLIWTFQTTGKVYSSPFVFDGSVVGRRGTPLVAAASTDGTAWILDAGDGQTLASFTLPGELFSSPVVWGRSLVVGCRNDFVYCLKLTVKDET
ncbi:Beta-alanine-activating enzyme [Larimichthys crocea]|uniref:Uncharacterized protein n=1 Tax=Larimichthys crocea TaxID=215358 RepID=A0ACD3RM64_LARCR|nr:Beta-alanine-activating enzyme [Larimichthys crocea]